MFCQAGPHRAGLGLHPRTWLHAPGAHMGRRQRGMRCARRIDRERREPARGAL